jgi:hypothetical protein
MAGILDFLQSPDAQLGIGLLAAGGPTTDPNQTGFGQRLAGAMNSVTANQQIAMRAKLMQSQIDENAVQNQLRAQQMVDAQRKQAILAQWAAGGSPAGGAGAGGPMGGGASPAGGGMSQGAGPDFSPGTLARLKLAGIDMTDVAKLAQPNWQNINGNLVNTNDPNFKGGIQEGAFAGQDGRVTLLRKNQNGEFVAGAPGGSLQTFGAFEQEKAKTTPGKGAIGPDQRMYPTTVAQDMGIVPMPWDRAAAVRGGGGPTNSAERGMAASIAEPNPDPVQAAQRERASILRELPNAKDPQSQAAMRYQIADLDKVIASGGAGAQTATPSALVPSSGKAGGTDFSPAEKAQQEAQRAKVVDTAKADVVRDTGTQKKAQSAGAMIAAADRAIELLRQGPTASGAGALVDSALNFAGMSSKGAEVASQLDIVSGDLVNNVPRMEGPQSDGDRLEYKLQAGRASDRTIPVPQRISALEEVKKLQSKYAQFNGGAAETPKPAGKVIDELPKTAPVGKRLRNTETGKIMQFDGLMWKEQ